MKKTGNKQWPFTGLALFFAGLGSLSFPIQTWAADAGADNASFTAQVDRTQLGLDESVSLRLVMESGGHTTFSEPSYEAPDFELVNQYQDSQIRSLIVNGQFSVKNAQTLTLVLRPTRAGNLKISQIHVKASGRVLSAPDIALRILPAGAGAPPPRGYGGGGVGLRGSAKRVPNRPVLVRAEVDKDTAFKGEQVIVSYYIYRKAQVSAMNVDKFPDLKGFLRDDMDAPVMGQRLDWERAVLDGQSYVRALLIRYAAYPLQDGKLTVDSVSLRYNYFMPMGGGGEDDDPISNFFSQVAPRVGTEKSDPITVTVMPLPTAGRPESFTGGVGDFNLTAAVNKYEVRANEPVSLTVKVEGRGNVAAINEPKVKWPDTVELYDTKGQAKSGKGGVGQKVFELLLIPRAAGKFTIPGLEMSFFDPATKAYVIRKTDPIDIHVLAGVPGSEPAHAAPKLQASGVQAVPETLDPLLPFQSQSTEAAAFQGHPIWRWVYWLAGLMLAVFAGFVGFDFLSGARRRAREAERERASREAKSWTALRTLGRQAREGASWNEVSTAYESLTSAIFEELNRRFGVGARALPRGELKRLLLESHGVTSEKWAKVERVLEFAEFVRFAGGGGGMAEAPARADLEKQVNDAEAGLAALV